MTAFIKGTGFVLQAAGHKAPQAVCVLDRAKVLQAMESFVSPALALSQIEDFTAVFRNYRHLAVRETGDGNAANIAVRRSPMSRCVRGRYRGKANAKDKNGAFRLGNAPSHSFSTVLRGGLNGLQSFSLQWHRRLDR